MTSPTRWLAQRNLAGAGGRRKSPSAGRPTRPAVRIALNPGWRCRTPALPPTIVRLAIINANPLGAGRHLQWRPVRAKTLSVKQARLRTAGRIPRTNHDQEFERQLRPGYPTSPRSRTPLRNSRSIAWGSTSRPAVLISDYENRATPNVIDTVDSRQGADTRTEAGGFPAGVRKFRPWSTAPRPSAPSRRGPAS